MRHLNCALLTGLLALWIFTGCATVQPADTTQLPTIDLAATESEEDLERLQQLIAAFEAGELSETIIRIPAGTELPVNLFIDTPMAHMESTCSKLYVDRELWLHVNGKGLRISPDGRQWTNMGDKKAMREAFAYEEGRFSIGLKATRDGGAGIHLSLEADPRASNSQAQKP